MTQRERPSLDALPIELIVAVAQAGRIAPLMASLNSRLRAVLIDSIYADRTLRITQPRQSDIVSRDYDAAQDIKLHHLGDFRHLLARVGCIVVDLDDSSLPVPESACSCLRNNVQRRLTRAPAACAMTDLLMTASALRTLKLSGSGFPFAELPPLHGQASLGCLTALVLDVRSPDYALRPKEIEGRTLAALLACAPNMKHLGLGWHLVKVSTSDQGVEMSKLERLSVSGRLAGQDMRSQECAVLSSLIMPSTNNRLHDSKADGLDFWMRDASFFAAIAGSLRRLEVCSPDLLLDGAYLQMSSRLVSLEELAMLQPHSIDAIIAEFSLPLAGSWTDATVAILRHIPPSLVTLTVNGAYFCPATLRPELSTLASLVKGKKLEAVMVGRWYVAQVAGQPHRSQSDLSLAFAEDHADLVAAFGALGIDLCAFRCTEHWDPFL